MKTYDQLYKKILNEYQIEPTSNQPKNPIIDNLMNYLKKTGMDTTIIDTSEVENILANKQEEEKEDGNIENTQQPVQNTPNTSVKSNVVSNIPVNNLTSFQNKNTQKRI